MECIFHINTALNNLGKTFTLKKKYFTFTKNKNLK